MTRLLKSKFRSGILTLSDTKRRLIEIRQENNYENLIMKFA